jgi:signal transduction histidine kinase
LLRRREDGHEASQQRRQQRVSRIIERSSKSVADSGKGIATQDVDRIFNPLFTTKSDGMGMGLSICRSIIEAHDGRLCVAGNTPRGAVFQFALPVAVHARCNRQPCANSWLVQCSKSRSRI